MLANLGKHTRRNLRYHRRKAEAELKCIFSGDVKRTLSRGQLKELNHASTHPVADQVLERRYNAIKTLEGAYCVGVRTPNGEWICLLGGRRHHGVSEIVWQMNRSSLEKYSVGTVVGAYLIEHEIDLGMNSLFFEGGTWYSIRRAFLPERAMDIVVLGRSPFALLLRKWARWRRSEKNFLLQTLSNPNLKWELHWVRQPGNYPRGTILPLTSLPAMATIQFWTLYSAVGRRQLASASDDTQAHRRSTPPAAVYTRTYRGQEHRHRAAPTCQPPEEE
jgi:hypothetical protein